MNNQSLNLVRNAFGRLVLVNTDNQTHETVIPVRAFPFSAPQLGISLVGTEGQELAWVDSLDTLAEESAALIIDELSKREFVPQIKSILSVSSFACPSTWQIDTDRGKTSLILKGEENIRRLSPDCLLISDIHGIEYMVKKISSLDLASRKLLDRFL